MNMSSGHKMHGYLFLQFPYTLLQLVSASLTRTSVRLPAPKNLRLRVNFQNKKQI